MLSPHLFELTVGAIAGVRAACRMAPNFWGYDARKRPAIPLHVMMEEILCAWIVILLCSDFILPIDN